jgi:hypothetical protein
LQRVLPEVDMAKSGLLDSLGLGAPPIGRSRGINPTTGNPGPTGPIKAPNAEPREEVAAPKKKGLDDAELTKALKNLPADAPKRAEVLAELATQVSDKIKRDPIVRALRDTLAKIQPIMSDADAKKKIDKAIDDLVSKGIKDGIMALLKLVVGKEPSKVDRDAPRKDGPNMPERDLNERIFKLPELPLPFDQPPKLKVLRFRLEVPKTVKPSKYFDFTLTTPDGFKPDDSKTGATWVLISTKDDYDKNGGRPTVGRGVHVVAKGKQKLSHAAPDDPGRYVIFVKVGPGIEASSAEEFEVK